MLCLPNTPRVRFIGLAAILFLLPLCGQADSQGTQVFRTLDDAVFSIGNSCGIRTGLETGQFTHAGTPITLQISCDSLPATFDRLISQRPGYTWQAEGDVYDVYLKGDSESVLNVRVSAFSVRNASLRQASDAIAKLPEFRRWLSKHHAHNNDLYVIAGHMWPSKRKVSLSLRNVSLMIILNRVAQAYHVPRWTVALGGSQRQYLAIRFNN